MCMDTCIWIICECDWSVICEEVSACDCDVFYS